MSQGTGTITSALGQKHYIMLNKYMSDTMKQKCQHAGICGFFCGNCGIRAYVFAVRGKQQNNYSRK